MISVSASQVLEAARVRAGILAPSTSTQVTLAMGLDMVQESGLALTGKLVSAYGQGFFDRTAYIVTTPDSPDISLASLDPPSFGVRWVSWVLADKDTQLDLAQEEDLFPDGDWLSRAPTWSLSPTGVVLYPTPKEAYTLRTVYRSCVWLPSSAPAQTYPLGLGWKEWLALDVTSKIRAVQEKDPSDIWAQRDAVELSLMQSARKSNSPGARQVQDARGAFRVDRRLR